MAPVIVLTKEEEKMHANNQYRCKKCQEVLDIKEFGAWRNASTRLEPVLKTCIKKCIGKDGFCKHCRSSVYWGVHRCGKNGRFKFIAPAADGEELIVRAATDEEIREHEEQQRRLVRQGPPTSQRPNPPPHNPNGSPFKDNSAQVMQQQQQQQQYQQVAKGAPTPLRTPGTPASAVPFTPEPYNASASSIDPSSVPRFGHGHHVDSSFASTNPSPVTMQPPPMPTPSPMQDHTPHLHQQHQHHQQHHQQQQQQQQQHRSRGLQLRGTFAITSGTVAPLMDDVTAAVRPRSADSPSRGHQAAGSVAGSSVVGSVGGAHPQRTQMGRRHPEQPARMMHSLPITPADDELYGGSGSAGAAGAGAGGAKSNFRWSSTGAASQGRDGSHILDLMSNVPANVTNVPADPLATTVANPWGAEGAHVRPSTAIPTTASATMMASSNPRSNRSKSTTSHHTSNNNNSSSSSNNNNNNNISSTSSTSNEASAPSMGGHGVHPHQEFVHFHPNSTTGPMLNHLRQPLVNKQQHGYQAHQHAGQMPPPPPLGGGGAPAPVAAAAGATGATGGAAARHEEFQPIHPHSHVGAHAYLPNAELLTSPPGGDRPLSGSSRSSITSPGFSSFLEKPTQQQEDEPPSKITRMSPRHFVDGDGSVHHASTAGNVIVTSSNGVSASRPQGYTHGRNHQHQQHHQQHQQHQTQAHMGAMGMFSPPMMRQGLPDGLRHGGGPGVGHHVKRPLFDGQSSTEEALRAPALPHHNQQQQEQVQEQVQVQQHHHHHQVQQQQQVQQHDIAVVHEEPAFALSSQATQGQMDALRLSAEKKKCSPMHAQALSNSNSNSNVHDTSVSSSNSAQPLDSSYDSFNVEELRESLEMKD